MLKPIYDRIVVKPDAAPDKSVGGIYIPEGAKEKPQRGTVVAVGPGKVERSAYVNETGYTLTPPMPVAVGDTVLYNRYGGTELTVGGEGLVIMRADDVLAVVEG
jgi:chaperonin GroES